MVSHGRTAGLLLALVATSAAAWALPPGWSLRFAFAVGWEAALAYSLVPRAEGDYLVGAGVSGYVLLGLALALLLYAIVTVRPRSAADPEDSGTDP